MPSSQRLKKTLVLCGTLALALTTALWIAENSTPAMIRQALPTTATDVQQYYDSSLNGDYARCLRAKMPVSEMPGFAAKLGLTQRYDAHRDAALPVSLQMNAPAWWTPPTHLDGAYFQYAPGQEHYSVVMYANGYVYFLATSW